MVSLDAPIFMAPLAGMMFLFGAFIHQLAGMCWDDDALGFWFGAFISGMALQIGAFVILINL